MQPSDNFYISIIELVFLAEFDLNDCILPYLLYIRSLNKIARVYNIF